MRHTPRSAKALPWQRSAAEPGSHRTAPLSPAIVTMVRHRIATGFYDTPEVKRAICEGVLAQRSNDGGATLS